MLRSAGGWLHQSSAGRGVTATLVGVQDGGVITCCSDGTCRSGRDGVRGGVQLHLTDEDVTSGSGSSGRTSGGGDEDEVVEVLVSVGDLLLMAGFLLGLAKPVIPRSCVVAWPTGAGQRLLTGLRSDVGYPLPSGSGGIALLSRLNSLMTAGGCGCCTGYFLIIGEPGGQRSEACMLRSRLWRSRAC